MLLRHVGEAEAAGRIEAAVGGAIEDGAATPDLARDGAEPVSTEGMADAIVERL
jgi:3-isopropylmalate dehydrogenase